MFDKITVADLIEKLEHFEPHMQIGISHDEEGNGFSEGVYPEKHNNIVILYPDSFTELDKFENYEPEEDDLFT